LGLKNKFMMMRYVACPTVRLLVLVSAFGIGTLTAYAETNRVVRPQPLDLGSAARGEVLYRQICFTCHGADLRGGIGSSLVDSYWKHGDSAEAIAEVLEKGIPDSNMVSFAAMFPQEDRLALAHFLISKQEGLRHLVRASYPPQQGELTLEALQGVKPKKVQPHAENLIYFNKNFDGLSHLAATLYIQDAGDYRFHFQDKGRTRVYLDGQEIYHFDEAAGIKEHDALRLEPGRYQLDILHQEPKIWNLVFSGYLKSAEGSAIALFGKALDGAEPKVHRATPVARLFRKRVRGLSSKSLIVFLPNGVIVAVDPESGGVEQAWSGAEIDQTPSVSARSAVPSVINGAPIARGLKALVGAGERLVLESTRMKGDAIEFGFLAGSRPVALTVSPVGDGGYRLAGVSGQGDSAPALFPDQQYVTPPDGDGNFVIEVTTANQ
jgi:mono/diheme cytochrome c family protein